MIVMKENYADKLLKGIGSPKNMMLALKLKGFQGFLDQIKDRLQRLGLKTKIKMKDEKYFAPNNRSNINLPPLAIYDYKTDSILINKHYFAGDDMVEMPDKFLRLAVSTVMHELVHAYQHKVIKGLTTDRANITKTGYLNIFIKGEYFAGAERAAWALTVALELFLDDETSMSDFNRWLSEGSRMAKRLEAQFDIDYMLKALEEDPYFDVRIHYSKTIYKILGDIIKLFGWVKSDLDFSAPKTYAVACTATFFFKEYINKVQLIVDRLEELGGSGLKKPSYSRADLTKGLTTDNYDDGEDYLNDYVEEIRFFNTVIRHAPVQYNSCQRGIKLVNKYYNRLNKV